MGALAHVHSHRKTAARGMFPRPEPTASRLGLAALPPSPPAWSMPAGESCTRHLPQDTSCSRCASLPPPASTSHSRSWVGVVRPVPFTGTTHGGNCVTWRHLSFPSVPGPGWPHGGRSEQIKMLLCATTTTTGRVGDGAPCDPSVGCHSFAVAWWYPGAFLTQQSLNARIQ